jgi:iron-sulfur cluster repair protein YtfE (RIC family)
VDIVEVILSDHHEQRRRFALLDEMHKCEPSDLDAVWKQLRILLEVHAKAEEELFYPELMELGKGAGGKDSAADETTDAIHDHNEIRDAIGEVSRHPAGTPEWWAGMAKLNEVNGDHMAEEEREGLTDFRQHASLELRHRLGLSFSIFESQHAAGIEARDVSPEAYVQEHE